MAFGKEVDPNIGKDTQFKPGVSGNPSGKPKGTKHISTWIQEMLNDEEFETYLSDSRDGWKEYKGAPLKAIIKVMSIKAMQGDVKAFDALAKHGWAQKVQLGNDPDSPLTAPEASNPELIAGWTEYLKNRTQDEQP